MATNTEELASQVAYKPFWERETGDSRGVRVAACALLMVYNLLAVARGAVSFASPPSTSERSLEFYQVWSVFDGALTAVVVGLVFFIYFLDRPALRGKRCVFGIAHMVAFIAYNEAKRVDIVPSLLNRGLWILATAAMLGVTVYFVGMCIKQPIRDSLSKEVSS